MGFIFESEPSNQVDSPGEGSTHPRVKPNESTMKKEKITTIGACGDVKSTQWLDTSCYLRRRQVLTD